jgi:prepilin signal peptidase PulO-like enzyme (type II secretory pathway)
LSFIAASDSSIDDPSTIFKSSHAGFAAFIPDRTLAKAPMSPRLGNDETETAAQATDAARRAQRVALWSVAGALVVGWAATVDLDPLWILSSCLLGWSLLALGWIDWHALRLPDALTLPLLGVGLAVAWLDSPAQFYDGLIGAIAGYAALVLLGFLYRLLRHRDGLGRGDAKLLAAGGAWLGWPALPAIVLLAALLGLLLALLQRLRGARLTAMTAIPFGPPLAAAIWLIWIYGSPFD